MVARTSRLRLAMMLERLEDRACPAAIWDGGANTFNWTDAMNWAGDSVPAPGDDVFIGNVGTIEYFGLATTIKSLDSQASLNLTSGSINITDGLNAPNITLSTSGVGVFLKVAGTTKIDHATLTTQSGSSITLTDLATYEVGFNSQWSASGTGSELKLPALSTLTAGWNGLAVQAKAGGTISMSQMAAITEGPIDLTSDGASSLLDLPILSSILLTGGQGSLHATNGGTVSAPLLTQANAIFWYIDDTSTSPLSQMNKVTRGGLDISGGVFNLSSLSQFHGSGVIARNSAQVTLPTVAADNDTFARTWQANGAGSQLKLPNLTSLGSNSLTLLASSGGQVTLSQVATIPQANVDLQSIGAGSQLSMPALVSFTGSSGELKATNGGTVQAGSLTKTDNVIWYIDGVSASPIGQATQITNGQLDVSGGNFNFTNLLTINNSSLSIHDGAKVTLPFVIDYSVAVQASWYASGIGSELKLNSLSSVTPNFNGLSIGAYDGAFVNLPILSTITGGPIQFISDGKDSLLNLAIMTSMQPVGGGSVTVTNKGTLQAPALTKTDNILWYLDGGTTSPITQLTKLEHGVLDISGGTFNLTNLVTITSSNFFARNGAQVTLPSVTAYTGGKSTWQATDASSELNWSAVTDLGGNVSVIAVGGGKVNLPQVATITPASITLTCIGADSLLEMAALTSFTGASGSVFVNTGGKFTAPLLSKTDQVSWSLFNELASPLGQLTQLTNGLLSVTGGVYNLTNLGNIAGSNFYAYAGATLTLPLITAYATTANGAIFVSNGSGSKLSLPALITLTPNMAAFTFIAAANSGTLSLPLVTSITQGLIALSSQDIGSLLDMPALTSMTVDNGTINAQASGAIHFNPSGVLSTTNVAVTGYSPGTIEWKGLNLGSGSSFEGDVIAGSLSGVGTVKPQGNIVGPLLVNGNMSITTGAVLDWSAIGLNGTEHDEVQVTGSVSLNGASLDAELNGFFAPTLGNVIKVIDNDGGDAIIGKFAGLPQNAPVAVAPNGLFWRISYVGGDGNDVTLTAGTSAPPTVTSVIFGDGSNQRSLVKQIVVNFSESVNFMGNVASAFTLHRTGTDTIGTPTGDVVLAANPVNGPASSVTITFSGPLTEFGSLKDGLYDFTIDAAEVSGFGGALDGNNDGTPGGSYFVHGTTTNRFFRFFGDSDGSGSVDQAVDFVAFKNAFGFSSSIFDFNNSGTVDQSADFVKFKNNFGLSP